MTDPVALELRGLTVGYRQSSGEVNTVVRGVDLSLQRGRILGVAGESGCGKSTTALAAIGYRASSMKVMAGTSKVGEIDLLTAPVPTLRRIWGRQVVYVPQASANSLTPALTIGRQLAEPMVSHLGLRGQDLLTRQVELIDEVGVADAEETLRRYPYQLSGGQQQRINLAIALSCNPDVLILDEPTTGLDVTTQARIVRLIKEVVNARRAAALFVSHDLPLLADVTDTIAIMYGGQVVETGPTAEVLADPRHPYTMALLTAVPDPSGSRALSGIPGAPPPGVVDDACPFLPRCTFASAECSGGNPRLVESVPGRHVRCVKDGQREQLTIIERPSGLRPVGDAAPLLRVDDVSCEHRSGRGAVRVVNGVTFGVPPGETLAIVGESGSGKSTLVRAIAGLHARSAGSIQFDGVELAPDARRRPRSARRDMQLIFQNPDMSLNPRHDVLSLVARPLRLFRSELSRADREDLARQALLDVHLPESIVHRFPSELSGGQKQRVAIARAFSAAPRLILADEITSALDVSVQAAILDLLSSLCAEHDTAVVYVSHDLAVVRSIAHRALVLKGGVVQAIDAVSDLFDSPRDEYTRELVNAIPRIS